MSHLWKLRVTFYVVKVTHLLHKKWHVTLRGETWLKWTLITSRWRIWPSFAERNQWPKKFSNSWCGVGGLLRNSVVIFCTISHNVGGRQLGSAANKVDHPFWPTSNVFRAKNHKTRCPYFGLKPPHIPPKGERRALGYSEFASLAKRVHTTSGIYGNH